MYLLQDASAAVRNEIMEHVGSVGWDASAWTEELLASRKLYPGHSFAAKGKGWAARLKTTDQTMLCFVKRVHATHLSGGRLDMGSMEALAERAALLMSAVSEMTLAIPVSRKKLVDEWVASWVEGDGRIDNELQALGEFKFHWQPYLYIYIYYDDAGCQPYIL